MWYLDGSSAYLGDVSRYRLSFRLMDGWTDIGSEWELRWQAPPLYFPSCLFGMGLIDRSGALKLLYPFHAIVGSQRIRIWVGNYYAPPPPPLSMKDLSLFPPYNLIWLLDPLESHLDKTPTTPPPCPRSYLSPRGSNITGTTPSLPTFPRTPTQSHSVRYITGV